MSNGASLDTGWLAKECDAFNAAHPNWDITFNYGVCAEGDAKATVTQDVENLSLIHISFIMNATESAINIAFNASLSRYGGDVAVGAMTILSSIMQLQFMPVKFIVLK